MTCEQRLPGAAGVACLGRTGPQDQDHEVCVGDRVKRAYGFDFANAALGFIMPTLGPIEHVLPHERRRGPDP